MSPPARTKCLLSSNSLPSFSHSHRSRDIELCVGIPPRNFFLDKTTLCNRSPFSEAALSKRWKEGHANLIELPDDDIYAVQLYCCWVAKHCPLVKFSSCKERTFSGDGTTPLLEHKRFVDAYIFGDKVLDRDFCDMILDHLLQHAEALKLWPIGQFLRIFNVSGEHDPPRKLLSDIYVYVSDAKWYENPCKDLSMEAWQAIAYALYQKHEQQQARRWVYVLPGTRPWHTDPCCYHWHQKTGGRCYKKSSPWEGLQWSWHF